jgi:Ca-activated chloride channel family protein
MNRTHAWVTALLVACASAAHAQQAEPANVARGTARPADATPPAAPTNDAPPPAADFDAAVRAGRAALEAGDNEAAATAFESALGARPTSAEAAYNLGVALYRGGKFKEAATQFARAGASASGGERTDAALSASSQYNRAASFYGATREQAEAAQRMLEQQKTAGAPDAQQAPEPAGAPVDPEALKQAIKDAGESLKGFKDAAYADPSDKESRANAEQSRRLLRALQELQKQQQQQQQKKDQDKKEQDQQQDDNKQDQQDKQDQQKDDQQDKDQEKKDQQDKDKQDDKKQDDKKGEQKPDDGDKQQDKKDQQKQDGKDKDKDKQDQQQPKPQDQPTQDEEKKDPQSKPSEAQPKDGQMTKEQADRLLQAVRDRERERRAAQERKAQAEAGRGRPPIKDW